MTSAFRVGKFDQSTGAMHEYDLPTPRTIIRFIYSDKDGNVWFPNNNNNKIGMITQSAQQPAYPCDSTEFIGIPNKYAVSIDEKEYSGRYLGSMSNITANIEKTTLEIDTTTDCLVIELPRDLIDSTRDGQDAPFTVLIDGKVSNAAKEETDPNANRVLEINLPTTNTVKKVEIIGTSIAPEFGSIVIVAISVLMAAMVALVKVFSKRSGL